VRSLKNDPVRGTAAAAATMRPLRFCGRPLAMFDAHLTGV
jgi:hypothetical protein